MSKTIIFKYYGDEEGMDDFTVTVDDDGKIIDSSMEHIKKMAKDPLFNRLSVIKRRYYNQNYEIAEEGGTEDDVEKQFGELGELTKFDVDKKMVFGWAYVSHDKDGNVVVDKSGEFIEDHKELEEAAYEFVIKSRVAGDHHQRDLTVEGGKAKQVGTMVESIVFTPEKVEKMGLPKGVLPTGWWVGFKIDDDSVWKAVKEGKRPAFSIHGKAHREEVQ